MILKDKTVAIVGAGPVGLTMAILLQQRGANVTVYERDNNEHERIWGGTLDLHKGSGQEALKRAGLLNEYFRAAKPMGRTIVDLHAEILTVIPVQYETPEINRNDLRQLLLNSLATETVLWGKKFTSLDECDGKWLLRFKNGTDAIADLVIGANGGMSQVKKYVTNAETQYTGTYIIQGEVIEPEINCPEFYKLCNNTILMSSEKGINFVANPDNNGLLTYNVTFRKSDNWVKEGILNFEDIFGIAVFLSEMFSGWNERFHRLFHATTTFVGLPARNLPVDNNLWITNRALPIMLVGDAAHVMPPFAGRGLNTGLLDALILSDNLTSGKHKSVGEAIDNYEQQMFVYAKIAQLETYRNEIAMHQFDFLFQNRFKK